MKYVAALLAAGVALLWWGGSRAADDGYRPLAKFILWDETNDRPWTTPKGHQSITGPTACLLAAAEAAREAPSGTRFSCRRISK